LLIINVLVIYFLVKNAAKNAPFFTKKTAYFVVILQPFKSKEVNHVVESLLRPKPEI